MWTYIIRRLLIMIPTLFGVTVVSFCVMQFAPGDPMLQQYNAAAGGQTGQTRDAYLIQKRDLKLDKPIITNFRGFHDYGDDMLMAAYFRARSEEEISVLLPDLAAAVAGSEEAARVKFLKKLDIPDLEASLQDQEKRDRLAAAILSFVQVFCEDTGIYGVADTIRLLESDELDLETQIGLLDCLKFMVVDPYRYTYSRTPSENETEDVTQVWKTWWEREKSVLAPLDPDRREVVQQQFQQLVDEPSRTRQLELLQDEFIFDNREDLRVFVEALLDESSTLEQKAMAANVLKLYVARPLETELPQLTTGSSSDAVTRKPVADEQLVERVKKNWLVHYNANEARYNPSFGRRLWNVVADTQYAHMVWRLATFNFGRSATKTKEPVSKKLWEAVIVSAPLMLMSQLVIYFIAIPLGFLCAVNRGNLIDRGTSLALFFLYSVPPFVAAMMFLLFFCYGDFLKWFPMERLHSDGADDFGFFRYMLDYLWHAFLPVVCLSLFSLAGLAMYSRSSMLDVIGQDFIRTARAKGLSGRTVILKHAARNSMIPILTLFANFLPAMLGGSVLIEYLFGIPGMGRLGWESILNKDTPTLMALIYVQAIVVLLSMLLTDILYVVVDPRISFEAQGKSR